MLKKYAYHRMLMCLISKNEYKELRKNIFLADINYVMKERDCAEVLKAELGTEIQS